MVVELCSKPKPLWCKTDFLHKTLTSQQQLRQIRWAIWHWKRLWRIKNKVSPRTTKEPTRPRLRKLNLLNWLLLVSTSHGAVAANSVQQTMWKPVCSCQRRTCFWVSFLSDSGTEKMWSGHPYEQYSVPPWFNSLKNPSYNNLKLFFFSCMK